MNTGIWGTYEAAHGCGASEPDAIGPCYPMNGRLANDTWAQESAEVVGGTGAYPDTTCTCVIENPADDTRRVVEMVTICEFVIGSVEKRPVAPFRRGWNDSPQGPWPKRRFAGYQLPNLRIGWAQEAAHRSRGAHGHDHATLVDPRVTVTLG